jgi:hypothetical protein
MPADLRIRRVGTVARGPFALLLTVAVHAYGHTLGTRTISG